MNKEEYYNYLQSEEWQKKRNIILEKSGGRCQLCDSNKSVQVHHRSYKRLRTEDELLDLIALCKSCHEITTFQIQKIKPAKEKPKCNIIKFKQEDVYIVLTDSLLNGLKTSKGGYTAATINALGVRLLRKGWKRHLVGSRISDVQYQKAKNGITEKGKKLMQTR